MTLMFFQYGFMRKSYFQLCLMEPKRIQSETFNPIVWRKAGSPSHVKSGAATSWMGISFRKAGFWQRGFPLTTLVFFSHWPSQAKWQSHTYGLDRRLLWKYWGIVTKKWKRMKTYWPAFKTLLHNRRDIASILVKLWTFSFNFSVIKIP